MRCLQRSRRRGKRQCSSSLRSFLQKGLRVIAVAKGTDRSKLEFVGLAGIADRIREDSRAILDQIRELGVEVKMLTGDSLPIAKNIAQQIGLGKNVTTMSRIQEDETKAATSLTQQSKTAMALPRFILKTNLA